LAFGESKVLWYARKWIREIAADFSYIFPIGIMALLLRSYYEEPCELRGSSTVLCLRTVVLRHTGVRGLGVGVPITYSILFV